MIRAHLRGSERGQSIVMFAIMLAAVLGLLSLGLDLVNLYAERRHAQAVADMAVIGGAVELDGSGSGATNAIAAAQSIITANGYTLGTGTDQATACINPYYVANTNTCLAPPVTAGGSAALEVTVTYHAHTIFATTMGYSTTDVLGRAVATRRGINEYAVYANSTGCSNPDGVKALGSGGTINGRVHSNSELNLGSNWAFNGAVTYYGASGCTVSNNNPVVPVSVGLQSWPLSATVRDLYQYPCTWTLNGAVTGTRYADDAAIPTGTFKVADDGPAGCSAGQACSWWADAAKTQLKPGIYCVRNGDLRMTGMANVTGTVTLVASGNSGSISVNANNFTLHPFKNNVLMFNQDNSGATAIDAAGSGGTWEGWIYARLGGLKMTGGGGLTLTGGLFGDTVDMVGSGWSLLGTGPNSGFAGQLTE